MTNFIGIDPGADGCIAWIDSDGALEFRKLKDATPVEIAAVFAELVADRCCCLLERVSSSPQMGVVSAFSFGRSYGWLEAMIAAYAIPCEAITPNKWQGAMNCRSKGDKNVTKRRAQQLWPGYKITHANADAVLLATLCKLRAAEMFPLAS